MRNSLCLASLWRRLGTAPVPPVLGSADHASFNSGIFLLQKRETTMRSTTGKFLTIALAICLALRASK